MGAVQSRTVAPDVVSVTEAAVLLSRHHDTVYRWIRAGKLEALEDPGGIRVPLSAIARALKPVTPCR